MQIEEFRDKIKPGKKLVIEGIVLGVKEVVKFRLDNGECYFKCFLDKDYIFADDSDENIYLLVEQVKTPFKPPFLNELVFDDKNFKFIYDAHAIAEEIQGEEIF